MHVVLNLVEIGKLRKNVFYPARNGSSSSSSSSSSNLLAA